MISKLNSKLPGIIFLFLSYLISGLIGITFARLHDSTLTAFWLPSGIALLGLIKLRKISIPVITVASFICNIVFFLLYSQYGFFPSLFIAIVPTLLSIAQPLLAYYFLKENELHNPFEKGSSLLKFLSLVVFIPCASTSVIAALYYNFAGLVSSSAILAMISKMWGLTFTDAYGIILVFTAYHSFLSIKESKHSVRYYAELTAIAAAFIYVTYLTFYVMPELIFSVIPILLVVSVVFGLPSYSLNILIFSLISLIANSDGKGPFIFGNQFYSYALLAWFLVFTNVTFLYLIALLKELSLQKKKLENVVNERDEELSESESHYRFLFNTAPIGMSVTSDEGDVINVNQVILDMLGYTEKEMKKNKMPFIYVDENERRRVIDELEQAGYVHDRQIAIKTKEGKILHILLTVNYFYLAGRKLMLANWINITDKVEAERQQKEMQGYLKAFLENIPIHLFMKDSENRTILLSSQFEEMLGKPIKELLGKTSEELFPAELAEKIRRDDDSVIQNNIVLEAEEELNGRYYYTKKIPYNNGEKKFLIGYTVDITKEKINGLELIKAKEETEKVNNTLKELNSTKDKFFSIIAHDMKNPFQSLIGLSDILLQEYSLLEDEKRLEIINSLNDSAKNGFELLSNLLLWSRNKLNRLEFVPAKMDLYALVNDEIKFLKPLSSEKNIIIKSDLQPGTIINVDGNLIRTIVRNLLTNAVKFSYKNSSVLIYTKSLQNGFINVMIKDNGIGIDEENISRLFRIDTSFSTYGTNREQGTGLGLILCKEFVEKHGGTIGVESRSGEGSTFWFTIPV